MRWMVVALALGMGLVGCEQGEGDDDTGGEDAQCDFDGDGYRSLGCGGKDCNDGDDWVHPGALEVCDHQDNDCDDFTAEGADRDQDGNSVCGGDCDDSDPGFYHSAEGEDYDGDGFVYTQNSGNETYDCDDCNPYRNKAVLEVLDGLDNDCDYIVDEGTDYYDDDGDGYSEAAGDCDDAVSQVSPRGTEIPDGLDNDCDGEVDEQ